MGDAGKLKIQQKRAVGAIKLIREAEKEISGMSGVKFWSKQQNLKKIVTVGDPGKFKTLRKDVKKREKNLESMEFELKMPLKTWQRLSWVPQALRLLLQANFSALTHHCFRVPHINSKKSVFNVQFLFFHFFSFLALKNSTLVTYTIFVCAVLFAFQSFQEIVSVFFVYCALEIEAELNKNPGKEGKFREKSGRTRAMNCTGASTAVFG